MKTLTLVLALLGLSITALAAPSAYDLSLKGIVVESDLATAKTSPAQLSLEGIVVEDVLLPKQRQADRLAQQPRPAGAFTSL